MRGYNKRNILTRVYRVYFEQGLLSLNEYEDYLKRLYCLADANTLWRGIFGGFKYLTSMDVLGYIEKGYSLKEIHEMDEEATSEIYSDSLYDTNE